MEQDCAVLRKQVWSESGTDAAATREGLRILRSNNHQNCAVDRRRRRVVSLTQSW